MTDQPAAMVAPSPPLALIGMPGSGKSTVGRHLARQLGIKFVDSDHEIEHAVGCSVRTYFDQQGEAAFRDLEQQTVLAHGLYYPASAHHFPYPMRVF